MTKWLDQLIPKHVQALTPYESARRLFSSSGSEKRIWMNANESPEADTFSLSSDLLNRYPDCQPKGLISAYAHYAGTDSQQVIATRGADEGIELIIRAFCPPNESSILVCPPTYGMYAISAQTFAVGVEVAPLLEDFSLNLSAIQDHVGKVNVVFLCSPNNPTGTALSKTQIKAVLEMYADKAIVVLDEAYIEFNQTTAQQNLLDKFDNLVILRTLSKGFALAGIRCGFILSSQAIKQVLLKVIAPYPISDPVAQIACQALSDHGIAKMRSRVDFLKQELTKMSSELENIPTVTLMGSQCGNFVLFKSEHNKELMQYLVSKNVLIRDQSKQLLLDRCLRISIGNKDENRQLLKLIQQFFNELKNESLPLNTSKNETVK